MENVNRVIRLARHPVGIPKEGDFSIEECPIPATPSEGVLVRNVYMSLDPYMRGRMIKDRKSYVPSFQVGDILEGGAVGEVVESRSPDFKKGDSVVNSKGWREYFVASAKELRKIRSDVKLSTHLGVLGMPGLTAYCGVTRIGRPKSGESVFISAAAGAVGSTAGQIAKILGCRVIGSAGSDEKVEFLVNSLHFDAAFNYKEQDITAALSESCPQGIDFFFDNVGGVFLQAALRYMNVHAKVAVCWMISQLNEASSQPVPNNLMSLIVNRVTVQGFLYKDYEYLMPEFTRKMSHWLREGQIVAPETVVKGLENAPRAFIGLFEGRNLGKLVVRIRNSSAQDKH